MAMQNTPQLQLHPGAQRSPMATVTSLPTPVTPIHAVQSISPGTFLEPPQYLTAISVPTVLTSPVAFAPASAAVISPIQSELGVIMTPAQTHVQDQLHRKHEQLQAMIMQQQEELRLVSEQLLMTRYGILPPIVNVCYPATSTGQMAAVQGTPVVMDQSQQQQGTSSHNSQVLNAIVQQQQQSLGQLNPHHPHVVHSHQIQIHPQQQQLLHPQQQMGLHNNNNTNPENLHYLQSSSSGPGNNHNMEMNSASTGNEMLGYATIDQQAMGNTEVHSQVHQVVDPQQQQHPAMLSGLEMIPYQLTQQQAHVLFGSNMPPNQNAMGNNPGEG